MARLKKGFLIIAGSIFVFLGVVGLFLPIMPTTPFLLLAAACYVKSSKKLYDRLLNHKVLGTFIKGYIENNAIPLKAKVISLVLLWISLSVSFYLVSNIIIKIILLIIGAGVTIHILSFKTLKKQAPAHM